MKRPIIDDLVGGMEDMATLPATIIELLCLLDNPTTSAENVQKVLERDVAMTTNVLKLGNSAYYGSRREIFSVREAIVLLGNRSVATLAFAAGMAPILRRDLDSYNLSRNDFWDHALVTAAASSLAADQMGIPHLRCEAFTVGLVHDVGMLLIDSWLAQQGKSLEIEDHESHDYLMAENLCLGFDHAAVGSSLAWRWGFPDLFVQVIAHHHDLGNSSSNLSEATKTMIRVVAAGNLMAGLIARDMDSPGHSTNDESKRIIAELSSLGIDPKSINELRLALTENLEETLASATRCSVLS